MCIAGHCGGRYIGRLEITVRRSDFDGDVGRTCQREREKKIVINVELTRVELLVYSVNP